MRNALIALGGCVLVALACSGSSGPLSEETLARLELNGDGAVDCADLEHLLTCLHHPDDPVCAHADFNGDGVVDPHDAHAVHQSLAQAGHGCSDPAGHVGSSDAHHHPSDPHAAADAGHFAGIDAGHFISDAGHSDSPHNPGH